MTKNMDRKIKMSLFLAFALSFSGQGFAQDFRNRCGDLFDQHKYSVDSFSVKRSTYIIGHAEIVLTALIYDIPQGFYPRFQLWLELRRAGRVVNSKFLGGSEGENGCGLLANQPLKDFFILYQASEFTGIYHLISREGVWYEMPGSGIIMNKEKNKLYTYVPVECGGCEIGKFSVHSRKLATKYWNGKGVAWREVKNKADFLNLSEDVEWITLETIEKFR